MVCICLAYMCEVEILASGKKKTGIEVRENTEKTRRKK